jgi:hypothetical protein
MQIDRNTGEVQDGLSQRHLPRPHYLQLLGILIRSAAQLIAAQLSRRTRLYCAEPHYSLDVPGQDF